MSGVTWMGSLLVGSGRIVHFAGERKRTPSLPRLCRRSLSIRRDTTRLVRMLHESDIIILS